MEPAPDPASRHPASAPPPRTGAFADVRSRWLIVWVIIGGLLLAGASVLLADGLGNPLFGELEGILFYLPIIAWVVVMVVIRAGVDLRVMLRWPRLGAYWFVVAGMLVVQFVFSLASIMLTTLVAPGLGEALEGVGQGNVILAVVGLVVLPPLVEEVLFRGVLIERYTVKWRVGVAVVVSAIFFAILHADPLGAGAFGVITGLLYLRTGSLWPGIIIHAVNNMVALTASRIAPAPDPDEAELTVASTLISAGVLLLISVPFLAMFIKATWPARGTLTPYQRHELVTGLPTRNVPGVTWSLGERSLALQVTDTHATFSGTDGQPVAVLPLQRVRACYPSFVPGGVQVVLLLWDGSWTTLQIAQGAARSNRELAATLNDRALAEQRRAAGRRGVIAWTDASDPDRPGPGEVQLRTR